MSTDRLMRILLRLAIAFVAFQIAALIGGLALFAYFALGGDPFDGYDFPDLAERTP
jgi:hypothetical protein